MIKVKRENVIYSISEEDKGEYLKKGYSLLDSNGKEIKVKNKNSDKDLEKVLAESKELTKTVEDLTKKNSELEAEKVALTKTVEDLTKKVEALEKSNVQEDTEKAKGKDKE